MQWIDDSLAEMAAVHRAFVESGPTVEIERAIALLADALTAGNKVLACGNGGSMADAMHFAEELTGRFRGNRRALPALALSDPAMLSCIANDFGYDAVFERAVQAFGQDGDVLVAISTSGNSPNVLRAAAAAHQQGLAILALTGKDGGQLAPYAATELRIPHHGHADRIQEMHIKLLHLLVQGIERQMELGEAAS
jgi:D-sedoheptulose 7-phosphate isomerase